MTYKIKVRAPASVSNLSCGFDVIGLALNEPHDLLELELNHSGKVEIADIRGDSSLSHNPDDNVVGVVLRGILAAVDREEGDQGYGFRALLEKGIRPGSGIGSSGGSAAAAAFAANQLLGNRFTPQELVGFAMEGERLASGSAHADNVAPSLLGGIIIIRSYEPLDLIHVNIPRELWCVVIHPAVEVKTSVARSLLGNTIPLRTAVRQWGNLAGLVAGFYTEDYDLIGRSLEDYVAEPARAHLIPGFREVKKAALDHGALGSGISGAGPSIYALCHGRKTAQAVIETMSEAMKITGTPFDAYLSQVNTRGTEIC